MDFNLILAVQKHTLRVPPPCSLPFNSPLPHVNSIISCLSSWEYLVEGSRRAIPYPFVRRKWEETRWREIAILRQKWWLVQGHGKLATLPCTSVINWLRKILPKTNFTILFLVNYVCACVGIRNLLEFLLNRNSYIAGLLNRNSYITRFIKINIFNIIATQY